MKPLAELPADVARSLRGVLFDLDDTLLTHGVLTRAAYGALWDLHEAGLKLVAVTGRPCGWGHVVVRQWPIEGAVTENGAVHVVRDGAGVAVRDTCDETERRARRTRLAQVVEAARTAVPEARLTDDQSARVSDVTWDIGEREHLPEQRVLAVARVITDAGARSVKSSVHLHATFDTDDKATGAARFCARELGEDAGAFVVRWAFAGDSANDAACFAAMRTTFGVANVRAHVRAMSIPPRYVATSPMGDGFAEIAAAILRARA